MPDTLTAPAAPDIGDAAPATPTPGLDAPPTHITDASKAFLAGLTDEQRRKPLEELVAKPADPTPVPATSPQADGASDLGDAVEEGAAPPDGSTWDEATKRWRTPDGKFVNGAAPETPPARVTLPGIGDRGEEDLDIEVSDPVVAERLERLRNDGLRRQEYNRRVEQLTERESAVREFSTLLQQDPVGLVLTRLSPDTKAQVARALLIEHMETLAPEFERLSDPDARRRDQVELRDRMADKQKEVTEYNRRLDYSRRCINAAAALVPEHIPDDTRSQFLRDAERDLVDAANRGEQITPDTVPNLIKERVRLYAFGAALSQSSSTIPASGNRSVPAGAVPGAPPVATARPLNDRAQAITTEQARAAQARIQRTQVVRDRAAAVSPPGVGVATVSAPVVPVDADIREASRALRAKGVPQRWNTTPG